MFEGIKPWKTNLFSCKQKRIDKI